MEEMHHQERDLRYLQADLATKEAFAADLRQKLLDRDRELTALREERARPSETKVLEQTTWRWRLGPPAP